MASVSGGIGIVRGILHEEYKELKFLTVGIPIEGTLFWTPFCFLRVGIYGLANLDPERLFSRALLYVQIGKLRLKRKLTLLNSE